MTATVVSAPAVQRSRDHIAVPRKRRSTTALSLRVGMALACLPVAGFAAAVQLGIARNDAAVRTVTLDATQGITVAQDIKLNLAELDEIVVEDLLAPVTLGPNGYPAGYDDKRDELHDNLVLAASTSPPGAAYRQPLANIDYALGHYHTLVKEAFAAHAADDPALASSRYDRAHEVMEGTLLSAADFVDKANTYVLNDTYDTQKSRSASTLRLIVYAWAALVAFLVLVQVLLARKFRRLINVPLAAATVLAVAGGWFTAARLDTSSNHLAGAREQAFDAVHVLARAGATVVSARQAEGHLLLDPDDPASAAAAQGAFDAQTRRLFRVQGSTSAADVARSGDVPNGAGGYLAKVAGNEATKQRALVAFADFVADDARLRQLVAAGEIDAAAARHRGGATFDELTDAIAEAQTLDQSTFDAHARAARRATAQLDRFALATAAGVLGLALLGLYLRLREYGT